MKSNLTMVSLAALIPVALAWLCSAPLADHPQTISILLALGAISLTGANWYVHHQGRNPSFLFLALGCVFLCGRAIPALFGQPSQLGLITFNGETASVRTQLYYAQLVLTSFACIHIGSICAPTPKVHLAKTPLGRFYFLAFLLLLPAYFYKNISYIKYVYSNGGYLAIYMGSEHIQEIGLIWRAAASMCLGAFILYFFHEENEKRAERALVAFLVVFSIELIVGLRGKFFITALVLFYYKKLRFGSRFTLKGLLVTGLVISLLSVSIEFLRERKDTSSVGDGPLVLGFLAQQGVSAGVPLIVMEHNQQFQASAWDYAARQFLAPFIAQPDVPPGWFLANDISMYAMPDAYARGFGTGSSYLAELYLLGGPIGIIIFSLGIGWALSISRTAYQGATSAILFWGVCGMIYYPRTMLQEPFHNIIKYALPMLALVVMAKIVTYKNGNQRYA